MTCRFENNIKNYPELVSNLKLKIMKTLNSKKTNDIFANFVLTSIEMIKVRGGEGEIKVTPPPVKI
jgi:hypothetical protein